MLSSNPTTVYFNSLKDMRKRPIRQNDFFADNYQNVTLKDVPKDDIILAVLITNNFKCAIKLIKNIHGISTTHISAISKKISSHYFNIQIAKLIFINIINNRPKEYNLKSLRNQKDIEIFNDFLENTNDIKYKDLNLVILYAKLIKKNTTCIYGKLCKDIVIETGKDFEDKKMLIEVFNTIKSAKKAHEIASNIDNLILDNSNIFFQPMQIDFFPNSTAAANCFVDPVLESSCTDVYTPVLRSDSPLTLLSAASLERSLIVDDEIYQNQAEIFNDSNHDQNNENQVMKDLYEDFDKYCLYGIF